MSETEVKRILAKACFKFRSDTLANWEANNPVLLSGEAGVVTGLDSAGDGLEDKTQKIKFGDGVHSWTELDWWYGPQGAQCQKGDQGERGLQGERGAQGIQGEKGADGYTPVKGVDYYTEEDKAEMVSLVLAEFTDVSEVGQ